MRCFKSGYYWNAELFEEKAGLGCLGTTDLVVSLFDVKSVGLNIKKK